jgi:lipopolysaccharide assembly LptE-like protein
MRWAALVAIVLATLGGCGYQAGHVAEGNGERLCVPLFSNETFRRDQEKDLTRAVHEEFAARTGYHLVSEEQADLVLTGRLVDLTEGVISERDNSVIRVSSVLVTVEVTVTNRKTGEQVVEPTVLKERQPFAPVKGESIRTAELAAYRILAERIVQLLSSQW